MKRKLYLFLLALLALGCLPATASTSETDSLLCLLDAYLQESHEYVNRKEERIGEWRQRLACSLADEKRYEATIHLFEEYKSYKYDSAYSYAQQSLALAEKLQNVGYVVESKCAIAFCLVSSGLFKEAFDVIKEVNADRAPLSSRITYYTLYSRLYYDIADYSNDAPYQHEYIRQGALYTDSLLTLLPAESQQWLYAVGQRQMKERQYEACLETFRTVLRKPNIDPHQEAMITSSMGWIYGMMGDKEQSLAYLIRAAINDIRSATKETTALCTLANHLYSRGDIDRANRYIKLALEDANSYNARHRKITVGSILPIIEQDRFDMVTKQRNVLMTVIVVVTLLVALLLVTLLIIYKQVKKLRAARHTIVERNEELQQANRQLSEANNIKVEYIGYSLYLNSEYIGKMEALHRTVNRKIAARQLDDLRTLFKEGALEKERDNMYASFDETFLKLFPDFIAAYNSLFPEGEASRQPGDRTLTSEMRIFALIRLGICDSERIAKFLNYSVHTINTYKTRVKNKSLVSNEEFEKKIMGIKSKV